MKVESYKWIEKIKETMARLDSYDIERMDQKTIYRCLEIELGEAVDRREAQIAVENTGKRWSDEEVELITHFLEGKRVTTCMEGWDNLEELSKQLRRKEPSVKKKVKTMGLIRGISPFSS